MIKIILLLLNNVKELVVKFKNRITIKNRIEEVRFNRVLICVKPARDN